MIEDVNKFGTVDFVAQSGMGRKYDCIGAKRREWC